MFSAALPVERPAEWRSNSVQHTSRSAYNSPQASRRSSVSSIASAQTDPGLITDRSRQSSATSETSTSTQKHGFKGLFSKKEKKPKAKKDMDKIILTSKHAAAVKTRMMMDPRYKDHKDHTPVKTAGIVSTIQTGHLTAAQQEARHPHSGPPALHARSELPLLTRIASGDEQDQEDALTKIERAQLEWEMAKLSSFTKIREHEGGESTHTSAEQSDEEDNSPPALSPSVEKAFLGMEPRRPTVVAKNSYGGRFHRDQHGHWTR